MLDDSHKDSQAHSGRVWLIIGAVVVLTLVAILLVPDKQSVEPEAIPLPTAVRKPSQAPVQSPASEAVIEQQQGATAIEEAMPPSTDTDVVASARDGDRARQFLEQQPSVAALLKQARDYQAQGLLGDAWLLYFKAAREGSSAAAMALAQQADPAYFKPENSALAAPDVVQARKWYRLAWQNGATDAMDRLKRLQERLRSRAEQGDQQAALLVSRWEQQP